MLWYYFLDGSEINDPLNKDLSESFSNKILNSIELVMARYKFCAWLSLKKYSNFIGQKLISKKRKLITLLPVNRFGKIKYVGINSLTVELILIFFIGCAVFENILRRCQYIFGINQNVYLAYISFKPRYSDSADWHWVVTYQAKSNSKILANFKENFE